MEVISELFLRNRYIFDISGKVFFFERRVLLLEKKYWKFCCCCIVCGVVIIFFFFKRCRVYKFFIRIKD